MFRVKVVKETQATLEPQATAVLGAMQDLVAPAVPVAQEILETLAAAAEEVVAVTPATGAVATATLDLDLRAGAAAAAATPGLPEAMETQGLPTQAPQGLGETQEMLVQQETPVVQEMPEQQDHLLMQLE